MECDTWSKLPNTVNISNKCYNKDFLATQKQIGISSLSTWIQQDLFAIVRF